MKTVTLPCGERVAAVGLGTWRMGEDAHARAREIAALRRGLELGANLIDTAEMYGEGGAEEVVGEAIAGRRDEVFLVSKVYPHNASRRGAMQACERSLRRLNTDRIDLYLLHWRGSIPLAETLDAFERLRAAGKIRHYGVSNFDRDDMESAWGLPGGAAIQTDQVLYSLTRRGIEWDLRPWLRARAIALMAYSPLEQTRVLRDVRLRAFAAARGVTAAQVALAWLLRDPDTIVIPKSSDPVRVRENVDAAGLELESDALAELDRMFPPPDGPRALDML